MGSSEGGGGSSSSGSSSGSSGGGSGGSNGGSGGSNGGGGGSGGGGGGGNSRPPPPAKSAHCFSFCAPLLSLPQSILLNLAGSLFCCLPFGLCTALQVLGGDLPLCKHTLTAVFFFCLVITLQISKRKGSHQL